MPLCGRMEMYMLILKLIGGVCIICATTLYARGLVGELACRIDTLKALKQSFMVLKSELRYGVETLPSAFMHVGERCSVGQEAVRDFFWRMGEKLRAENGSSLKEVWAAQAQELAKAAHLDGRECDSLIRVADSLGYLDLVQQINNIELYLEGVDEDIAELSGKYSDNCRMYMGLGVMAGLFLTIILI